MDAVELLLASERVYLPAMRCIGVLTVVVSLVTVFLIVRHSTREMKHYKWMLLNQTVWTMNFGLLMGLFWIPIPLFPEMAAYVRGPLSVLGKDGAHVIMCVLSGSAICIANCLLISLVYRYSTVARLRAYSLMSDRRFVPIMILTNAVCFSLGFGLNYAANVPFEVLRVAISRSHPAFGSLLEQEVVFGYSVRDNPLVVVYGGFTMVLFTLFALTAVAIIYLLMKSLYAQRSLISKQKFNLQLSLFTAIAIQFLIPFLFAVLPIIVVTVLVQMQVSNVTYLCEVCLCSGCFHTVLSNATTVLIVKPYRQALLSYVGAFLFLITGRTYTWAEKWVSTSGPRHGKIPNTSVYTNLDPRLLRTTTAMGTTKTKKLSLFHPETPTPGQTPAVVA